MTTTRTLLSAGILALAAERRQMVDAQFIFDLEAVDQDFLTTAPWVITSSTDLPISVDDCWNIITDDCALPLWFPEVTNVKYTNEPGRVGTMRTIVFDGGCLNNLITLGKVDLEEEFDVWEDTGPRRRFSFYFAGVSKPPFYLWEGGREEYKCEESTTTTNAASATSSTSSSRQIITNTTQTTTTSRFTYTVALAPGFVAKSAESIVLPRVTKIFAEDVPRRLLESIANKDLPRTTPCPDDC